MNPRELDTGEPASAGAAGPRAVLALGEIGLVAIAPPTLQSVEAAPFPRGRASP